MGWVELKSHFAQIGAAEVGSGSEGRTRGPRHSRAKPVHILIACMPKSGPFAWNGLFVFWCPFTIFGAWCFSMSYTLLRAIKHQAK